MKFAFSVEKYVLNDSSDLFYAILFLFFLSLFCGENDSIGMYVVCASANIHLTRTIMFNYVQFNQIT